MQNGSRRVVIGGVLLAVLLIAAACGGNKKAESSDSAESGAAKSPSEISNGDTDAKPKRGGTLTFALEAENSGGWCMPEAQLAASGIQVANAVYDPLVAFDENFEPKPFLAKSVEMNDAATLFTFELRPGVKFHDGTPLTARVVKLNLDLLKGDPAAKAETGRNPILYPLVYGDLGEVTVVDDLNFTVATKRPWPAFLNYLAAGRNGIAAEAQLKSSAEDCKDKLIGTGPFKFVNWDRNVEVDLERNPDYWMKDRNGVQLPYLDKLVFKPIPTGPDRLAALESGAVDAMHFGLVTSVQAIERQPDKFNMSGDTPGHREVGYAMMNVSKPPFDDIAARKALLQALDRDRLNKIATDGRWTLANGPFDTAVMGYLPDLEVPAYDPEAAKKTLGGKSLDFTLTYAADPNTKKLVEEIQREVGQIGGKVDLVAMDQAAAINKALSGDFSLVMTRNHPGSDPDTQYVWFYSTSLVNFSRIKDPELDTLWDAGRSELDQAKRKGIYEQINRRMSDQAYEAWLFNNEWKYATARNVHNFANYMLPDDDGVATQRGAGMNWGWSYLVGVWRG